MLERPSKKRKQSKTGTDTDVPSKKSKKEGKKREKKSDKGKTRDTEFHVVKASLVLSVPPIFAANPRAGIEEMLDSMVMRYIPALRGVVLSHSNLQFLTKTATIQADSPFLVCNIGFDATIWSPHVGMKLVGKVNLCSPDHVSILLHRTFNVSIPRHHIPQEQWVFEYGPAENDPEFGPNALDEMQGGDGSEETGKHEGDGGGRWVHHLTNEKLGGEDGYLEFTVIGLTVANEMLSLLGSIQIDPFSLDHVPETSPAAKRPPPESEIEEAEVEQEVELEEAEDEIESDDDTFKALGKLTDEVAAAAAAMAKREAEREGLEAKEKKRRRKTEKPEGKTKRKKKT